MVEIDSEAEARNGVLTEPLIVNFNNLGVEKTGLQYFIYYIKIGCSCVFVPLGKIRHSDYFFFQYYFGHKQDPVHLKKTTGKVELIVFFLSLIAISAVTT